MNVIIIIIVLIKKLLLKKNIILLIKLEELNIVKNIQKYILGNFKINYQIKQKNVYLHKHLQMKIVIL